MKKYSFVLPLIFILGLAYWRYTYILVPNFDGDPFLIRIKLFNNNGDQIIHPNSSVHIISIISYWALFFLGNIALFLALFNSFEKVKIIVFFYLLLSFFSAVFFALDAFWLKSLISFNLASILKNFLLSPLFSAIAYIMIKYFHLFRKPS